MSKLIKLFKNIKSGPYVQFYVNDKQQPCKFWDDSSLYLDEGVYSMFSDPFIASSKDFIYFGPTIYSEQQLEKLLVELNNHSKQLDSINSHKEFIKTITSFKLGQNFITEYGNFKENWKNVLKSLIKIDQTLIKLVKNTLKENKQLLVLGI